MNLKTLLLGGKETAPAGEAQQSSDLNVNIVTQGGAIKVPQEGSEGLLLDQYLTPYLSQPERAAVFFDFLQNGRTLSPELAQTLSARIQQTLNQQRVAQNMRFRPRNGLGNALNAFRRGREDSDTIHLINQNIFSGQ